MLNKRYELLDTIGQGGAGTVYRAADREDGTIVAVKSLKPELTEKQTMVERFIREGEALRQLNHPNIVKMLDAIQEGGRYFLVMEYVDGGALSRQLLQLLPINRILNIAIQIADALTRAHYLQIVHRDIKPDNVLLDEGDTPRLTDFGIAHVSESNITETGIMMGTLGYLAPEIINGEPSTTLADIWSFGVMLFEMVSGRRPFVGSNAANLINQIVSFDPPDLETLRPDAPEALVDLIYRMLAKNPVERIPSVRLVGAELEAILQGRTTENFEGATFITDTSRFDTPTPVTTSHNLPAQTTDFVGREVELDELREIMRSNRLVTILAPGGMGKTRLSIELARRQLNRFEHGVYFVELAPLTDPANIANAIAEAVKLQFQQDERSRDQQIFDYIADKEILLVLDNFEHLLLGVSFITELLQACPNLKSVVTSRQRLGLSSETVFQLDGMDVPDFESPEDVISYSAIQFFMQSARRARPDFELTDDNLDVVVRICRLVYGMPLGILLAASWLELLSPEEISKEINESLDFLESVLSDLPERQRSIRAVFDYSWHLLSEAEQDVFMKLSITRGGFDRDTASAIAGANLRLLMGLMSKSLIRREPGSGRFYIHELLRQYAEEQLAGSGRIEETRDAHCNYYLTFVGDRFEDLRGGRQLAAVDEIDAEMENIRVAWFWAVEHGYADLLDAAVLALYWTGMVRWDTSDVEALMKFAADKFTPEHGHPLLWVKLQRTNCWFPFDSDMSLFERCLELARELEDPREQAFWLAMMHQSALTSDQAGLEAGLHDLDEAIELADSIDDKFMLSRLYNMKSIFSALAGEGEVSFEYVLKSEQIKRDIGDMFGLAGLMNSLGGHMFFGYGEYERAKAYYQEGVDLALKTRFRGSASYSSIGVAAILAHEGKFEHASQLVEEALVSAAELNIYDTLAFGASVGAFLDCIEGDVEQAMSRINEWRDTTIDPSFVFHVPLVDALIGILSDDAAQAVKAVAHLISTGHRIGGRTLMAEGMMLAAVLADLDGDDEQAAKWLGALIAYDDSQERWYYKWEVTADLLKRLPVEYPAAFENGKASELVEAAVHWLEQGAANSGLPPE